MFHATAADTDMVPTHPNAIAPTVQQWEQFVGQKADEAARQNLFTEALAYKAPNTIAAYTANMATFCNEYLPAARLERDVDAMMTDPSQWAFLTYGIVKGFREWLLGQGYALTTVQHKLSTVKFYARLAAEAGAIAQNTADMIAAVKGPPAGKQGKRLNEKRQDAGVPTRLSSKKRDTLTLTPMEIHKMLSEHPDTPQGRRDRIMVCQGLEHAMRGVRTGHPGRGRR
jgi:hypothetical protein